MTSVENNRSPLFDDEKESLADSNFACGSHTPSTITTAIASKLQPLKPFIDHLQLLSQLAISKSISANQLAVTINEAITFGLRESDLRVLILDGLIVHLTELRDSRASERHFLRASNRFQFCDSSCFQWRNPSEEVDDMNSNAPGQCQASETIAFRSKPSWNRMTRCLEFDGKLVKRFSVPAPIQEMILSVFQEEGWPTIIDDPLPPIACHDSKQRLRDTVRCLNRSHREKDLIKFCTVDNGESIQWSPALTKKPS
ncbi:MAG: hypothetical protein WCI02_02660 [Planctomycetota bacterium]